MPFINAKTNVRLSEEKKQEIGNKLSEAISILPGKSYHYLMTAVEDNVSMMFHRDSENNIAMVEVKLFGKSTRQAYENLNQGTLCASNADRSGGTPGIRFYFPEGYCKKTGNLKKISGTYCYVKFSEVEHWGFDGSLF